MTTTEFRDVAGKTFRDGTPESSFGEPPPPQRRTPLGACRLFGFLLVQSDSDIQVLRINVKTSPQKDPPRQNSWQVSRETKLLRPAGGQPANWNGRQAPRRASKCQRWDGSLSEHSRPSCTRSWHTRRLPVAPLTICKVRRGRFESQELTYSTLKRHFLLQCNISRLSCHRGNNHLSVKYRTSKVGDIYGPEKKGVKNGLLPSRLVRARKLTRAASRHVTLRLASVAIRAATNTIAVARSNLHLNLAPRKSKDAKGYPMRVPMPKLLELWRREIAKYDLLSVVFV